MRKYFGKFVFKCGLMAMLLLNAVQTSLASNITIDDAATNLYAFTYTQANTSDLRSEVDGGGTQYTRSTATPSNVRGSIIPGSAFVQITPAGSSTSISTSVATFAIPGTIDDIAVAQAIVYFTVAHDTLFTLTDTADITTPVGQQGGNAYGWNVFGLEDANHNNIVQGVSYGGVQTFTGTLYAGMEYDFHGYSYSDEYNGDSRPASAANVVTLTTGDEVAPSGPSDPSAVPEPSSFSLVGLGGIGLVIAAYRRRRTVAT